MKVDIKGTIVSNDMKWVYDWCELDATCPNDVRQRLEDANGENIEIYINSGGGEIFAGSEIYSLISTYTGKVKIHVVGLAASAASVIMCAAESDIAPTAMVMIHNVSSYAEGNYIDFEHEAEVLQKASQALCTAYVNKTGKSAEEMQQLMDQEKWFTAQEAVNIGLCDEIASSKQQLVAAIAPVIPPAIAEKLKAIKEKEDRSNAMKQASDRLKKMEKKA